MDGVSEPSPDAGPPSGVRWEPDAVIDGYRLVARVGAGGCGEVWRARDPSGRGDVALKRLITRSGPEAAERLRSEAERAGRLNSPHVVPVYGTGELDGAVYIVMRLVPDGDLAALLRAHPAGLAPARAVRMVSQLAHALDAAHRHGIVHRDVKPANVLLEHTPSGDVVQLGDFGLAVDAAAPGRARGAGTGAYLAPEVSGDGRVTGAADVYALGCVLAELLTGRPPFSGPDPAGYRYQHEFHPPRLPGATSPALAAFDPVLTRSLAKRPDERFPSAGALAEAATGAAAAVRDANRAPSARRRPAETMPDPAQNAPTAEPAAGVRAGLGGLRRRWRGWSRLVRAGLALTLVAALATAGWFGYDRLTGPVSVAAFRACISGLGLSAPAVSGVGAPSFRIGEPPRAIGVTFHDTASAADTALSDFQQFALPHADRGVGGEIVARKAVVLWGAQADPRTVAAVEGCL